MKKILTVLLALSILLTCATPVSIVSADSTYVEVANAADFLTQVSANADIKLTESFDLGNWTPVAYSGKLDGNGKTLTVNVSGVSTTASSGAGLFSNYSGVEIKNLTIDGTVSASGGRVGALAGVITSSAGAVIDNCINKATVTDSTSANWWLLHGVGGLIGTTDSAGGASGWGNVAVKLTNCVNEGTVTGPNNVGGLVGVLANKSSIDCSSNKGSVTGRGNVGGLVGRNFGAVTCSYNLGNIEKLDKSSLYGAGGCIGINEYQGINASYNAGLIKAPADNAGVISAGGIAGLIGATATYSYIRNCYNVSTRNICPIVSETNSVLTVNNCYYLTLDGEEYDNINPTEEGTTATKALTMESMKTINALTAAGFVTSTNNYYFPQITGNINNLEGLYTVYVSTANGTASPIISYVKNETNISIDYKADEGFKLAKITVNNADWTGNLKDTESGTLRYIIKADTDISFDFSDGTTDDGNDEEIPEGYIAVASEADFLANVKANANIYLTDDINLGSWTPVAYSGNLNGNGKTITVNVSGVSTTASSGAGLFSNYSGTEIKNLTIDGTISASNGRIGALAGIVSTTAPVTFENLVNKATVEDPTTASWWSYSGVGGLIGTTDSTGGAGGWGNVAVTLINCRNEGAVSGTNFVGGLVGVLNYYSSIKYSSNKGNVTARGNVGGLVGRNFGAITFSYNIGNIEKIDKGASYGAGGCIGINEVKGTDTCYNAGSIKALADANGVISAGGISGLFGTNTAAYIKNSYSVATGNISPVVSGTNMHTVDNCYYLSSDADHEDGIQGTTALTLDAMKDNKALGTSFEPSLNNYYFPQIVGNTNDLTGLCQVVASAINGTAIPMVSYVKEGTAVNINYSANEDLILKNIMANNVALTDSPKNASGTYSYKPLEHTELVFNFGSEHNLIKDEKDFLEIKNAPSASYKVTQSFTLGSEEKPFEPFDFSGTLIADAENMPTITVYVNNTDTTKPAGLFATVTGNVIIKNIKVAGTIISKGNSVGGIAGKADGTATGSEISNCINTATITSDGDYVGGIIGEMPNWTNKVKLSNLRNEGNISGASYVGGIAGMNKTAITLSSNIGEVTSNAGGQGVGGIVGRCYKDVTLSYNTGKVAASANVGGICGSVDEDNIKISNSYNVGTVESRWDGGEAFGITVAKKTGLVIENCYNLGSVLNVTAGNSTKGVAYDSPNKITKAATTASCENCYYLAYNKAVDNIEGTTALNAEEAKSFGTEGSVFVLNNNFTKSAGFSYPDIVGNENTNNFEIYTLDVTVNNDELGTVVPAGIKYILEGEENIIDCAPVEGYTVDEVYLNDESYDFEDWEFYLPKAKCNQKVEIKFDIEMPEVVTLSFEGDLLYGDLLPKMNINDFVKVINKDAVILALATIAEDNYKYKREDFGFVISDNPDDIFENGAEISLADKYSVDTSAVGTIICGEGIESGKTYYIAAYVKFANEEDISYGNVVEYTAKNINNTSAN